MVDGISVVCPNCHKSGVVPLIAAGKGIHCKSCGGHFVVPHAPVMAASTSTLNQHAQPVPAVLPDDDEVGLAPLSPEEEKHCRERYEGRTLLSKDRNELRHDADYERERRHHG
jgi:hypothetical protein